MTIKIAFYGFWFFFGSLLAAWPSLASAMEFTQLPDGAIAATGVIFRGDDDKLEAVLKNHSGLNIIEFSSPGGNAVAGMMIGALINSHPEIATMVLPSYECYSACALAWLGSSRRGIGYGAIVGFHGAFITNSGRSVASAPVNAAVGGYLTRLGFTIDAVMFATAADPDQLAYLTPLTADKYSIRAGFFNPNNQVEWHGGTVVASAQPASVQPAMDAKAKAKETAELPNIAAACRTVVDPRTYDYANCYRQETEGLHWAVTTQESYPKEKRVSCWKINKSYPIMRWKAYKKCVAGQ